MSERLAGRRVLITGAGRGIGRAIAELVAREGAAVGLLGRTREGLDETARNARAHGVEAVVAPADVADAAAVEAAIGAVVSGLGGLDGLVTAAAVDCAWAPTAEMDLGEWDRTLAVNLSGTFYCCRFALPHLVSAGTSALVTISSVAAARAWPEDVAYNASKAGVEMLTRTIAVEYGGARGAGQLPPARRDRRGDDRRPPRRGGACAASGASSAGAFRFRPTRWRRQRSGCSPVPRPSPPAPPSRVDGGFLA